MGMYTELIFGAKLKRKTPAEVINTLKYMVNDIKEKPKYFPEKLDRIVLLGSSYYFGVNEAISKIWYNDIDNCYRISTRSNIKNHRNEIETFLEWVKPYVDAGSGKNDMYAIVMYEEDTEPKIYYLDE